MWSRMLDPDVEHYLLDLEGEVLVDEIHRHWVTRIVPILVVFGGAVVLGTAPALLDVAWLPVSAGLGLIGYGLIRLIREHTDRFVVTNMRVFRVHGVFNRHMATVPIARILDISVNQPFIGMIFNYGHFVFESAAQEHGLKSIRYVPNIERHDRTVQTIIARSGVRARAEISPDELDGI